MNRGGTTTGGGTGGVAIGCRDVAHPVEGVLQAGGKDLAFNIVFTSFVALAVLLTNWNGGQRQTFTS